MDFSPFESWMYYEHLQPRQNSVSLCQAKLLSRKLLIRIFRTVCILVSLARYVANESMPEVGRKIMRQRNLFDVAMCLSPLEDSAIAKPSSHFLRTALDIATMKHDDVIRSHSEPIEVNCSSKAISREELKERIELIGRKLAQCQRRAIKFQELRSLKQRIEKRSGSEKGSTEEESGQRRGGGAASEIDPDAWLRRLRRRTRRLWRSKAALEQQLVAMEELEDEDGDEEDTDSELASPPDGGYTVAWAACDACGRDRITTRLLSADEPYRCGAPGTWANLRRGGPINCRSARARGPPPRKYCPTRRAGVPRQLPAGNGGGHGRRAARVPRAPPAASYTLSHEG